MQKRLLKIVFLDAGSVDLGDVDLKPLKKMGHFVAYNLTTPEELITRSWDADILITNKCLLLKNQFENLPHLKCICVAATGINNIDVEEAGKRGIAITNVKKYSTITVVEHTLLFLLTLSHRLMDHHLASLEGRWSQSAHFALLDFSFRDLHGKTLGLIGYGEIGKKVAKTSEHLGMKVLVAQIPGRNYSRLQRHIPLNSVLKKSDFISLHCPLSQLTRHLIDKKKISLMKKGAYLINLARGPIVVERDVYRALLNGKLKGYATDLMDYEPPPKDHFFFDPRIKGKILITPHIAWASLESRQRLINEIAKNIRAFQKGIHRNRVI